MTRAEDLSKTGSFVNTDGKLSLTTGVTGILPVANGGTGTSTGVAPGGSNTQVQFNNSGTFGGSANLTFNGTTLVANDITDSSLTPGRVVFPTTGGNLTGSADLFWDNANARLGIGTSSPSRTLDINGNMRLGAANGRFIEILNALSEASYISQESAAELRLNQSTSGANSKITLLTQGAERMRIDSSGNVGIGTTSPTDGLLHLNGGSQTNIKFTNAATGTSNTDGFFVGLGTSGDSSAYIYQRDPSAIIFGTSNTERLRINSSGAISVGSSGTATGSSGQALLSQGSGSPPVWGDVSSPVKAWVNFNGNGGASIRASFNVSSVSYNSTGRYTLNFTSALADANYCAHTTTTGQTTTDLTRHALINGSSSGAATMTTSALQVATGLSNNGSAQDMGLVCVSVLR